MTLFRWLHLARSSKFETLQHSSLSSRHLRNEHAMSVLPMLRIRQATFHACHYGTTKYPRDLLFQSPVPCFVRGQIAPAVRSNMFRACVSTLYAMLGLISIHGIDTLTEGLCSRPFCPETSDNRWVPRKKGTGFRTPVFAPHCCSVVSFRNICSNACL